MGAGNVAISTGGKDAGVSAAIGASVAVDDITNTTDGYVDGSSVAATIEDVQVLASSNMPIVAVAAGGTFATSFSLGGSVVYNKITDTTEAFINNSTQISGPSLAVSATDSSNIGTGAGEVAIAKSSLYGQRDDHRGTRSGNTVEAYINGSTVTKSGAVAVTADSGETILVVAVGTSAGACPGASSSASLVGSSLRANRDHRQHRGGDREDSTVNTPGAVSLMANDTATITAGAGALAFEYSSATANGSVAIGASAAVNTIGSTATPDPVIAAIKDARPVTARKRQACTTSRTRVLSRSPRREPSSLERQGRV